MARTTAPRQTARVLVSLAEAADYAQVHTCTIRRWIADGRLTGYRAGPRLLRVDMNQLDALLTPVETGGDAA